jgi:hypothetical protein
MSSCQSLCALVLSAALSVCALPVHADVLNPHLASGSVSNPAKGVYHNVVEARGPGKLVYASAQVNGPGVYGLWEVWIDGNLITRADLYANSVTAHTSNDPLQWLYSPQAAGGAVIAQYTPPEALAYRSSLLIRMRLMPQSATPTTFGAEALVGDYPQP